MPTPTYTALANITLGAAANSVSFASIPASFRDLVLVVNLSGGNRPVFARYNSDTGVNYTQVVVAASTSPFSSQDTSSNVYITWSSVVSGERALATLNIMDYSATDKHKTTLIRSGYTGSATFVEAHATRWANTSAITSIQVFHDAAANFGIGSTFNLFGIGA